MTSSKAPTLPPPARRGPGSGTAPAPPRGAASLLARRIRRFRKPSILIPAVILVVMVLLCFLGPTVFNLPPASSGNLSNYLLPIGSPGHLLGTNTFGNDMLAQLLVGGRVSITVAAAATALGLVIGSLIGMVAGYYEGIVGGVLMRVLDVIFAFPDIVLAIAIAAYLGPSMTNAIWAIGFFGIAGFGRIARAQTLRVAHQDYVVAARSSGASALRILLTHIWPNIAGRVVAYALVALGYAMMAEAALSFLGLGVPTPTPSWGNIIGTNQSYISVAPQLIWEPAILIFITIASANLLGDALQEKRARDTE
jgi:peptide/nickel transport system permease protein